MQPPDPHRPIGLCSPETLPGLCCCTAPMLGTPKSGCPPGTSWGCSWFLLLGPCSPGTPKAPGPSLPWPRSCGTVPAPRSTRTPHRVADPWDPPHPDLGGGPCPLPKRGGATCARAAATCGAGHAWARADDTRRRSGCSASPPPPVSIPPSGCNPRASSIIQPGGLDPRPGMRGCAQSPLPGEGRGRRGAVGPSGAPEVTPEMHRGVPPPPSLPSPLPVLHELGGYPPPSHPRRRPAHLLSAAPLPRRPVPACAPHPRPICHSPTPRADSVGS